MYHKFGKYDNKHNSREKTENIESMQGPFIRQFSNFPYSVLYHTIRKIAKFIGNIVATFPAVTLGPFYYRKLEKQKIMALKTNNFDKLMVIDDESRAEVFW